MNSTQQDIKHLLFRAGFGPHAQQWEKVSKHRPAKVLQQLVKISEQQEVSWRESNAWQQEPLSQRDRNPMLRKMNQERNRNSIKRLNLDWVNQMVNSEDQLREKMALFWHDHFACRLRLAPLVQRQLLTLRTYALSSFRELLFAISRDPGMLQFLNNQQNRKAHPNENFARELLELFTLGRGHYTEKDIQEAARAFTGWGFNLKGEFVFRKRQHDEGNKTFLGRTGNFGGEDILNIILDQPRTARFLVEKLYRFLVHPELNEEVVEAWSQAYRDSDYDTLELLVRIFSSDHFYESRNQGARIKSPIEFLVSMNRMLGLEMKDDQGLLIAQKALGQVLLQPPNVAGWPDGRNWIDSSTLMLRLRIPQAVLLEKDITLQAKGHFAGNEDGFQMKGRMVRKLQAKVDWEGWKKALRNMEPEEITSTLRAYFLQVDAPYLDWETLQQALPMGADPEVQFRYLFARIVGTPEFQMC